MLDSRSTFLMAFQMTNFQSHWLSFRRFKTVKTKRNYFITISLLYYFGVELCDFRGDIRLRILPYWAYLTVWSVEFRLSIFAFLVNFIVGFCIGRLPGTCKSSDTKSQEN